MAQITSRFGQNSSVACRTRPGRRARLGRVVLLSAALACLAVSPASAHKPVHPRRAVLASKRHHLHERRHTPKTDVKAPASPTLVAWFCAPAPATPCPPQVHTQIIGPDIYQDGTLIGHYVDNEDPTQQQDVTRFLAQGSALVIAGISEGDVGRRITGAVSALEWYPWPTWGINSVPPRGYAAYILQGGFFWPTNPAPTAQEIQQSYCGALAYAPKLIAFYYWTPAAWAAVNSARCGSANGRQRRAPLVPGPPRGRSPG